MRALLIALLLLGEPLIAADMPGGLELQLPKWASKAAPGRVSCPVKTGK